MKLEEKEYYDLVDNGIIPPLDALNKMLFIESLQIFASNKNAELFVTAKFGGNWKENAKKHYDFDTLVEIAFFQGRRAELLEQVNRYLLKDNEK